MGDAEAESGTSNGVRAKLIIRSDGVGAVLSRKSSRQAINGSIDRPWLADVGRGGGWFVSRVKVFQLDERQSNRKTQP